MRTEAQRRLEELEARRAALSREAPVDAVAAHLRALSHDIELAKQELDEVIRATRERARRLDEAS